MNIKRFTIVVAAAIAITMIVLFPLFYLLGNMFFAPVHTTGRKNNYINSTNREDKSYADKWNIDCSVFPDELTEDMTNISFLRAYCAPLDSTEMAFLSVEYPAEQYKEEALRLESMGSSDYNGHYGIAGFNKYKVLTISVTSQGIHYALTDGTRQVIYYMLSFSNGYSDIDFTKYVDEQYLPVGFDAITPNNY